MNSSFKPSVQDAKASPFNRVKMNRNLVTVKNQGREGDQTPTDDESRDVYTIDRTFNPNA